MLKDEPTLYFPVEAAHPSRYLELLLFCLSAVLHIRNADIRYIHITLVRRTGSWFLGSPLLTADSARDLISNCLILLSGNAKAWIEFVIFHVAGAQFESDCAHVHIPKLISQLRCTRITVTALSQYLEKPYPIEKVG